MCSVYPPYYLDKKHFQISMIGVYKYVTWVFHRWGEFYAMCLKFNNSFPHETNLEFAVTHLMLFNFLFFLLWATRPLNADFYIFLSNCPAFCTSHANMNCKKNLHMVRLHGIVQNSLWSWCMFLCLRWLVKLYCYTLIFLAIQLRSYYGELFVNFEMRK